MEHRINFKDVDHMVLWLLDNNIDELPVSLILHIPDEEATE